MAHAIDIDALRGLRAHVETMARFYSDDLAKKRRENDAMSAAGLKPLHGDFIVEHDKTQGARFTSFGQALDAILAHVGADQAEAA